MTENSQDQPTTRRTLEVRLGTDEDLARHFGSRGLLIGFPVTPTASTPPSSPTQSEPLSDSRFLEDPDDPTFASPRVPSRGTSSNS